jgi:hypothetical protein
MLPAAFSYPSRPHSRRHGPRYRRYQPFKPWLRDEFTFRCVYCLFRERWYPSGQDHFSVEHVTAKAIDPGRECDYDNLVYACLRCNSLKLVSRLLDPCADGYGAHLRVRSDGSIEGLTIDGARLIEQLRLDETRRNEWRGRMLKALRRIEKALRPPVWRRLWNSLVGSGEQALPPGAPLDTVDEVTAWLGFPDDLPDLGAQPPRGGNSRPGGLAESYFAWRHEGRLPRLY